MFSETRCPWASYWGGFRRSLLESHLYDLDTILTSTFIVRHTGISMKESDLYLPLKRFLESQNYEVKGEVQDCDVLAVRGEEVPVVVELKLSFNLNVVLQAVERLSLTPKVYIGIPRRCGILNRRRRQIIKLLRMLGLGLVAVDPDLETGNVEVLLDPGEYKPRKSRAPPGAFAW